MARILGIDFGTKRTGIAVTDPLQIIVNPLTVLSTEDVIAFLQSYCIEEDVCKIVYGMPGEEYTDVRKALDTFLATLKSAFPDIEIDFQDEHLTSHKAAGIIRESGLRKMQRRDKGLVDKVSAVLILQEYLGHLNDVHPS